MLWDMRNSNQKIKSPNQPEFTFYDPSIKDKLYQELLEKYYEAEKKLSSIKMGSPNMELFEENAIIAEQELDDYCNEKGYNQNKEWGIL